MTSSLLIPSNCLENQVSERLGCLESHLELPAKSKSPRSLSLLFPPYHQFCLVKTILYTVPHYKALEVSLAEMNLVLIQASPTLLFSFHTPPTWSSPYPESALTCLWIFYWDAGWRPRPPGEEGPGPLCTAGAYMLGRVGCLQWRSTWQHQSPGAHPTCRSECHIPPRPHPGVWWSVEHRRIRSEGPGRCSSPWLSIVWCHWQPH